MSTIYDQIYSDHRKKKPRLAVLIDPDKFNPALIELADSCNVHYFFVGGSKLTNGDLEKTIAVIKKISRKPVIIFPGDEKQVSAKADALLFLSLLSGRNPDYLIGKQVLAAPVIRKKKIESISTAYILIGGNKRSATQVITGTDPIAAKNNAEIIATAMAGEMLGFKAIYLEAGSGAESMIPPALIRKVRKHVQIPLLVGGGMDTPAKVRKAMQNGADVVVIGNALEKDIFLIKKLSSLFETRSIKTKRKIS